MCGIVGFIDNKQNKDMLEDMLDVINYRGPDDHGVYIEKFYDSYVHFGHNRLSIQDLSPQGHQPFHSQCGDYIIIYNGEVYNFHAIRTELEQLDYSFISHSDTEVILYAYKQWGIQCLEKFIGMFAISILDKINQKIILIRDRAGVKPLYYYMTDDIFMFASELKTFHKHSKFEKQLNKKVLSFFFQFSYIPAPWTIFENCYKLLPGHFLEFDLKTKTVNTYEYWNAANFYNQEKKTMKTEKEIIDDIEKLLIDAFKLRMVSDVPVGVFLSGGYDSSLVTAILQKHSNQTINTFTIGFYEKEYNEAEHAKKIARHLGTNHTEYYCTKDDMIDLFEQLPFLYDEPFGDNSAIPTIILSKIAKESVTVALSADGGDEAFLGYSKYFALIKMQKVLNSSWKRNSLKFVCNLLSENSIEFLNGLLPARLKQSNIKNKYSKFKRAINSKSTQEMFINASSYMDKKEVNRLLIDQGCIDYEKTNFADFNLFTSENLINQMMMTDYKTFMVDDVLTKVDKATMSVSLEGREPLLDHRIVEYLSTVPQELKYKNNQGKYLLRQVLYRYLAKEMVDKPKSGFNIPLAEWLRGDLKYLLDRYLNLSVIAEEGLFNVEEVRILKNNFIENDNSDNVNKIWLLLVFQMWKEKWL